MRTPIPVTERCPTNVFKTDHNRWRHIPLRIHFLLPRVDVGHLGSCGGGAVVAIAFFDPQNLRRYVQVLITRRISYLWYVISPVC